MTKEMTPRECLALSEWFESIGGASIFKELIYSNISTKQKHTLNTFLNHLRDRSALDHFDDMSTNEKVGWRLRQIKEKYEQAQRQGLISSNNVINKLTDFAKEAKAAYP